MIDTKVHCPVCGKIYTPVLKREKFKLSVQEEFPNAKGWQREQLISGICSDKCWDTLFEPNTTQRKPNKTKPKVKQCKCR